VDGDSKFFHLFQALYSNNYIISQLVSTQGLTKRLMLSVKQLATPVDRSMLHHVNIKYTLAVVWQTVNGIQFLWLQHFVCHKKHEKRVLPRQPRYCNNTQGAPKVQFLPHRSVPVFYTINICLYCIRK